jgi:hypothetical protein
MSFKLYTSAFGLAGHQAVRILKESICGNKTPYQMTNPESCPDRGHTCYAYFNIAMKVKEGIKDVHNCCEMLNNSNFLKVMIKELSKVHLHFAFSEGTLFIKGAVDLHD